MHHTSVVIINIRNLLLLKVGALHGKLIGGGVAFCLATEWRTCTAGTSFNYGNLPRGLNPLFMFSRSLPQILGHSACFQIYLEDTELSSKHASACRLVDKIFAGRANVKHMASRTSVDRKY